MKIGFFGGAFDPFHQEHERIVLAAKEELGLDRVVVYPSVLPPHKSGLSPYESRKKAVLAVLGNYPFVIVDDVENERGMDKNPTCEVLSVLLEKYAPTESYLIIGGDSLSKFGNWIHPEKIAKMTNIAVVVREDAEEVAEAKRRAEERFGASVTVLRYVGQAVQSSVLRARIEFDDPAPGIDERVLDVIRQEGMYASHAAMVRTLRETLTSKRFRHSKGVAYYALRLNMELGLPYEQVFTAAALHDCAKPFPTKMDGVPDPVVHQFTGAERAKSVFGITDETVLDAIRYHTTGRPDMTTLGKLIFCADMLEEGRVFAGADELRALIERDFEAGFVACVDYSFAYVKQQGLEIHPLTEACVEWYNKRKTE